MRVPTPDVAPIQPRLRGLRPPVSRSPMAALGACLLAGLGAAQLPLPPGFGDQVPWRQNRLVNLSFDLLPGGEVIAADDATLFRVTSTGQRLDQFTLPAGAQVAFVRTTPDGAAVLVAESSQGLIWRHELASAQTRVLATVPYPFDLAFDPTGRALLSANPLFGTPGAHNQLLLLDPVTGATRLVARVSGPSGPVAFRADGALLYGTQVAQFPTPPGALRLLQFAPARLQTVFAGGPPLGETDATVCASGLDGAYALATDERGYVYVSDPSHGGILRVDAGGTAVPFVPRTGAAFQTTLRFRWQGPGAFAPCQPDHAAALWCVETDWLHAVWLRAIAPLRPQAFHVPTDPVPAGRLDLFAAAAPPLGSALLVVSRAAYPAERHVLLPGSVPLWFALDPGQIVLTLWQGVDATGLATCALQIPPLVQADLTCQWLVVAADQSVIATSWSTPLQLR